MTKHPVIYTYDPAKDKQIKAGILVIDTFIKKVSGKHYMIKEKGYGIQADVIEELTMTACKNVLIINKNHRYSSKLVQWINSPVKDYGHGEQKFLSVSKMWER